MVIYGIQSSVSGTQIYGAIVKHSRETAVLAATSKSVANAGKAGVVALYYYNDVVTDT